MVKVEAKGNTKDSGKFELRRQLVHLLLGITIILLAIYDRNFTLWLCFSFIVVGVVVAFVAVKFKVGVLDYLLGKFEREQYRKRFPLKGAIFFFAGSLLVLKLFSLDIALASIVILTFADSVSHLFGMYGRRRHPFDSTKNIEGVILGVLIASAVASIFVSFLSALVASVGAMIAEAVSLKLQEEEVDDNIIIPLVAGTIIFLLRNYI